MKEMRKARFIARVQNGGLSLFNPFRTVMWASNWNAIEKSFVIEYEEGEEAEAERRAVAEAERLFPGAKWTIYPLPKI